MNRSTALAAIVGMAVALGCWWLPAADQTIEVLHVSVRLQNELAAVLQEAGAADLFEVVQVGLEDFIGGNPQDLSNFNAIVFGISDAYEIEFDLQLGRLAELKSYVANGGGIFWTHDSLELGQSYGAEIEDPAGIQSSDIRLVGIDVSEIEICADHEVLHAPFEIGAVGDIFPKTIDIYGQYDHATNGIATTASIIIRHRLPPDPRNFYLTVNEYEAGRVAMTSFGHVLLGHPSARTSALDRINIHS